MNQLLSNAIPSEKNSCRSSLFVVERRLTLAPTDLSFFDHLGMMVID